MIASANPFRAERVEALPFHFVDGSWDALLASLTARGWRGGIVGPKGSGKTTLLEALGRHLDRRGMTVTALRLSAPRPWRLAGGAELPWRRLAALGPGDALLLDGAEQLAWPSWLALRAAARGVSALIVTTHGEGRLPTVARTRTTPALLGELLHALVPPADIPPAPEIQGLFGRHQGNLRAALAALYDDWSRRPVVGRPRMEE